MEKNGDWGREVEKFLRSIDLHRFFAGKIIINFHRIPMQITSTQKKKCKYIAFVAGNLYRTTKRTQKTLCIFYGAL